MSVFTTDRPVRDESADICGVIGIKNDPHARRPKSRLLRFALKRFS